MSDSDQNTPEGADPQSAAAEAATLQELEQQSPAPGSAGDKLDLDMILDVTVNLAIELGQAHMSIHDLLALNQGSIVELDRLAGDPLDVRVNGTLVARGEVVVVKDKFGIMLTEIVSPEERIRRLH